MEEARFVLSKSKLIRQYNRIASVVDKVSYSYKTNPLVGSLLEKETDCDFAVHFANTLPLIKDKKRVWFLALALSPASLHKVMSAGVRSFIIENGADLKTLLNYVDRHDKKINLMLRLRMKEHTIKTEMHYVYGMYSSLVNELIPKLRGNKHIGVLGVHFHRKTENIGEWEITDELSELLPKETMERIDVLNIGGGMPVEYKNYSAETLPHIFKRIKEARRWANGYGAKLMAEPGRFIAAPSIELRCSVIGIAESTAFVNCSVYNSAMDTIVDNVKLPVKGETERGKSYLIKGFTPDSRDIFRYKVRMRNVKIGDTITFLNAGAYTYSTDFCNLRKLKTVITA